MNPKIEDDIDEMDNEMTLSLQMMSYCEHLIRSGLRIFENVPDNMS